MKRGMALMAMLGVSLFVIRAFAEGEVPGSRDPALFTRMPGFYISKLEEKQFGSHEFTGKSGKTAVEGHRAYYEYAWGNQGKKPSSLQVLRNYENAIKRIGGTAVFQRGDDFITLKVVKDGKEIWAEIASEVDAGWGGYQLTIVQTEAMSQDVTASAATMNADIRANGHASVYGILFDTGKADIKPASDAAIAEIGKLLKQDPSLKLFVVGHTDNQGTAASNLKLSEARAVTVMNVLIKAHGIAPARLKPFGAGQYCPLATNASDKGRAKNRRVELVQQ